MYFLKTIVVNLLLVALTCSGQDSSSLDSSITSESSIGETSSISSEGTVESISTVSSPSQSSGESSLASEATISSTVLDTSSYVSESLPSLPSSETSIDSQSSSDSQSSTESTSSSETSIESQSSAESSTVASSELSLSSISLESISIVSSVESRSSESSTESIISLESFSVPSPSFMEPEESSESLASSGFSSDGSSNEFGSPTKPDLGSFVSSETLVECYIPDCRWCDHLDLASCECFKIAIDCMIGSALSEDGCSCQPIPGWNNSVSEESSTEPEVSETVLSSSPCFPIECPRKMFWSQSTCSCECLKKKMCKKHLEFNPLTCECEHMTTTKPSTTTPFVCSLPSCRPCDLLDEDNCVCHKTYLDCSTGFELTSDKCECNKPNSSESSQSGIIGSSSACVVPSCRPCDILDEKNCVCHHKIIDCAEGFELSDDRCGCEKSVSTSEKCPGLECPEETFIDEKRCECINEECQSAKACRKNLVMDPKSCECFCNLSPWQCKYPQIFDRKNCKCSHKNYHGEDEDPENCDYECVQKERCHKNFIFDYNKCECVCDSRKAAKKCPEGTKFDKTVCECVECLDFDDPQCTCDCDEILDCPGDQIFNFIGCECMCPKVYCEKGFEMDERTCECVWKGYGKQYKFGGHNGHNGHNGHSLKGGY